MSLSEGRFCSNVFYQHTYGVLFVLSLYIVFGKRF